nr:TetR family transcriptional regulator [uncultured bacterium]
MAGRITPAEGRYGGKDATERRDERRRRFQEAGLDQFGTGPGYRGTRLGDLCKAAGLSSRQFYEEYRTLEDLLADLHLHVNDVAGKAVAEALPRLGHLTLAEMLPQLVHAYVKGACATRATPASPTSRSSGSVPAWTGSDSNAAPSGSS